MMIDEVSGQQGSSLSISDQGNPTGQGTVNLKTFLLIMEKSSW
jgi:hypothetical protein